MSHGLRSWSLTTNRITSSFEQREPVPRPQPQPRSEHDAPASRQSRPSTQESNGDSIIATTETSTKSVKVTPSRLKLNPKAKASQPITEKANNHRSKRPTAGEAKSRVRPRSKLTKVISLSSDPESGPEDRGHLSMRTLRPSMHDVGRVQKDEGLPCESSNPFICHRRTPSYDLAFA